MATLTPRRSARFKGGNSSPLPPTSATKANGSTSTTPGSASTTASKMAAPRSPFQPTSLEALLLAIYPITLLFGSFYSLVDPATRAAPYNPTTHAHVPESAPSYFAKKTNLFNIIFVKRGWFWITISYFYFLFTHPSTGPGAQATLTPKRIQGVARWGIVTVWWIFVTQWFFGPAIIDRGFLLTGGQCELVKGGKEEGREGLTGTRQFVTSMACKAVGGQWKGGHDISGHVFLLVLGSMFLLGEVLHVLLRSRGVKEERIILMSDGVVKSAEVEAQAGDAAGPETSGKLELGVKIVLGVAALSIWMLLMTAIYFHTWFEKLTGLLVAFGGIFVVHFLPKAIPSLRRIVGMPGL